MSSAPDPEVTGLPVRLAASPSRLMGWVALLLGLGILVDGLLNGMDQERATVLVAVAIGCLCAWLAFVRPSVRAHADHLLLRNMVTDIRIPWHLIDEVDVRNAMRVFTTDGAMHPAEAVRRRGTGTAFGQWRKGHQLTDVLVEGYVDPAAVGLADRQREDQIAARVVQMRNQQREASLERHRVEVARAWPELVLMAVLLAVFVTLLAL